jgi:hypothetical protein
MWRDAAFTLDFRKLNGSPSIKKETSFISRESLIFHLPELKQSIPTEHGAEKESIGFQGLLYLYKHAW